MKYKNIPIKYNYNNNIHDCILLYITNKTIKIRVNQVFVENDILDIGIKNNYEINNWYWLKYKVISVDNQYAELMIISLYDEDDVFIENYLKIIN